MTSVHDPSWTEQPWVLITATLIGVVSGVIGLAFLTGAVIASYLILAAN